ncbi:DNA-(apurinic or apyrimidinic site) lyase 2 [Grifola frondosa]|uniref:DNA-(apurinic or apyrimidinic site) endonuclease n=1 Tax=Grifola frondosa TaxID=5627 RepID=A0A1C7LPV3_GRIFR|nr:DNA-(apurinic or apyrimidinic site) lyase 2 [Grifola frondosa]
MLCPNLAIDAPWFNQHHQRDVYISKFLSCCIYQMRIISWNINGIRTLPQYYPWNTFKSCEAMLDELKADIICFQEMKSSRTALQHDVALPGHYHSFFSFPANKGGYSGVAVYTDSRHVIPLKVEEGLSGRIQPKPPFTSEERVSPSYPHAHEIEAFPDEQGEIPSSFDALDAEGRALVADFGLFVLINVYCPNETSDARLSFKMNYHLMLEERVRKLIEEEHRDVIVVGDMNICATPMDHCDGHLPSNAATFWDHSARAWFHKWLGPNGPMIDVVRTFWPERKGLFTCWNTKIQARETNYGTRVDYILVTRGLLPWIDHGDIQPSLKGSDHCPIYIDLRDEMTLDSGVRVSLHEAMKQGGRTEPPRLAAAFWEEFSGKQTVLSSFFGKRTSQKDSDESSVLPSSADEAMQPSTSADSTTPAASPTPPMPESPSNLDSLSQITPSKPKDTRPRPAAALKRKASDHISTSSSKKKKQLSGQASIASFFGKPSKSKSRSKEVISIDDDDPSTSVAPDCQPSDPETLSQLEADYRLACELSMSQENIIAQSEPSSSGSSSQSHNKAVWSSLFAPLQPPNCLVHGEPTRLYTVNKQGPNKGKTFFLCSRPVGPGYDKGKAERLRDEVDHTYRCNFFKWASEVKKEALRDGVAKNGAKSN